MSAQTHNIKDTRENVSSIQIGSCAATTPGRGCVTKQHTAMQLVTVHDIEVYQNERFSDCGSSDSDDESACPNEVLASSDNNPDNPENEAVKRRRLQNKQSAKKFRDRKTRQREEKTAKNERLKNVNKVARRASRKMNARQAAYEEELRNLKRETTCLEQKGRHIDQVTKQSTTQLVLFIGHLEMIADTLDDDNEAKRLIKNLVKNLSPVHAHYKRPMM
ncbi:uncharacterized protein LOC121858784 [Homarus americanus]|uniref:BZIP domain-containing protein n=1 Tax=Homarus americanus TaxID=6706 RepID=A0A8J5THM3_HOMAM|nr:uncharacterized protein LOC121858784 [Homarus americanus]KAG7174886.1 hypothetical protein Hamer_G023318 [Homarus americanus]